MLAAESKLKCNANKNRSLALRSPAMAPEKYLMIPKSRELVYLSVEPTRS